MLGEILAEPLRVAATFTDKASLPHKLDMGGIFEASHLLLKHGMHPFGGNAFCFSKSPAHHPYKLSHEYLVGVLGDHDREEHGSRVMFKIDVEDRFLHV